MSCHDSITLYQFIQSYLNLIKNNDVIIQNYFFYNRIRIDFQEGTMIPHVLLNLFLYTIFIKSTKTITFEN